MANNKQTPLNSVRSAVKEKIDPFESMEVLNLAEHTMKLRTIDEGSDNEFAARIEAPIKYNTLDPD